MTLNAVHVGAKVPAAASFAGLRTRLVSRLTGLTTSQLRHWHTSNLLMAGLRPGERGVPRLYSWIDYLRLQLAAELSSDGVPTTRIREVVAFLDARLPDWYMFPSALEADEDAHVRVDAPELRSRFLASGAGQHLMELQLPGPKAVQGSAVTALATIADRGSLGKLNEFRSDVYMHPAINLGRPTVVDTALETKFLASTAADMGCHETARVFEVPAARVESAVQFESRVA